MQSNGNCTRNENSIKETLRLHASACSHVASVESVEQSILEPKGSDQEYIGSGTEQCRGVVNGVQPSEEVVQEELTCTRNESSNKDTHRFHASAFQHVASLEPAEQNILEVQLEVPSKDVQEKVACARISVEADGQHKEEVQAIVDNPDSAIAQYVPVDIPELDPEYDFRSLPNWMRYDPTQKVIAERYICIFCKCIVTRCDKEQHSTGKKHRKMSSKFASRCHASFNSLSTLMDTRYERELRLFASENIARMAEGLQSLTIDVDNAISVGFVIDYGHLVCLSLVTKTICMNIDRTILRQADLIRNMVEFREIFEGSCTVGGGNMWELMLVLYHRYGIRSNAVADMDEFATEDAGDEVSLSNPKLHHEAATKAVECYASVNACNTKLLSLQSTHKLMLEHICLLNTQMYRIYCEVRETILVVKWSNGFFEKNRTVYKVTCDEYKTRIRQNSLVRLHFSDHVIYGQCFEWDCARTGKVADIVLKKPAARGAVQKIFVNRKKEKLMRRVLLRAYISRLASSEFKTNGYQDHLYLVKPFVINDQQEEVLKKKMRASQSLNRLQNYCLLRSMFPISVIHGPPGTGKTRTFSVICQDAAERRQGVLCLCWTNVAVRRLCEAIAGLIPTDVVRIVTSREYRCWHEAECKSLKDVEAKHYECQVLCMTVSNYLFRSQQGGSVNKWSKGLLKQREVLLLDEASQLWEMEEAMVLNQMSTFKRVVYCGDRKQLPPRVLKNVDDSPSLLTWIGKLRGRYKVPCTQLQRQYRMMPSVGNVVSENFYEGTLVHNKAADKREHLFFHCVQGNMDTRSSSRFCPEDSEKCITISKGYPKSLKIQVLTFYQAQCSHVQSLDRNINVCCIDSFQGQEADIVILLLSARRCMPSKFMVDMGRLCVATSRAKKDFHIVGDWKTMMKCDIWKKILGRFRKVY